jgi:proline iminopeptidase
MMAFYHQHFARKLPWSADLDSAMSQLNPGPYIHMQGPSEFTITGTLRSYNQTASLKDIKVPTLFMSGQYDEVVPSRVESFRKMTPGSKLEIIPDAAHMTMQDQPDTVLKVLRDWLRHVERE